MIKIQELKDVKGIKDKFAHDYIMNLLEYLFKTYEVDNIESFGAIFYIESKEDLLRYSDYYLSSPLTERRFEWVDDIGNGYVNGCIVLDNERAINLISPKEYFTKYMEE